MEWEAWKRVAVPVWGAFDDTDVEATRAKEIQAMAKKGALSVFCSTHDPVREDKAFKEHCVVKMRPRIGLPRVHNKGEVGDDDETDVPGVLATSRARVYCSQDHFLSAPTDGSIVLWTESALAHLFVWRKFYNANPAQWNSDWTSLLLESRHRGIRLAWMEVRQSKRVRTAMQVRYMGLVDGGFKHVSMHKMKHVSTVKVDKGVVVERRYIEQGKRGYVKSVHARRVATMIGGGDRDGHVVKTVVEVGSLDTIQIRSNELPKKSNRLDPWSPGVLQAIKPVTLELTQSERVQLNRKKDARQRRLKSSLDGIERSFEKEMDAMQSTEEEEDERRKQRRIRRLQQFRVSQQNQTKEIHASPYLKRDLEEYETCLTPGTPRFPRFKPFVDDDRVEGLHVDGRPTVFVTLPPGTPVRAQLPVQYASHYRTDEFTMKKKHHVYQGFLIPLKDVAEDVEDAWIDAQCKDRADHHSVVVRTQRDATLCIDYMYMRWTELYGKKSIIYDISAADAVRSRIFRLRDALCADPDLVDVIS
jgi:hypothetical protein